MGDSGYRSVEIHISFGKRESKMFEVIMETELKQGKN